MLWELNSPSLIPLISWVGTTCFNLKVAKLLASFHGLKLPHAAHIYDTIVTEPLKATAFCKWPSQKYVLYVQYYLYFIFNIRAMYLCISKLTFHLHIQLMRSDNEVLSGHISLFSCKMNIPSWTITFSSLGQLLISSVELTRIMYISHGMFRVRRMEVSRREI